MAGETVSHYRILMRLGEGGMGVVIMLASSGGAKRFNYVMAGCDGKVRHVLDPEILVPKPGRTG